MRTIPFKLMIAILFASVGITGCATKSPVLDSHFGEAVNAAKAQQTLNPEASKNNNPVAGVDGQAAKGAVDLYQNSFVQPPPSSNVFNIGVGSDGGDTGSK